VPLGAIVVSGRWPEIASNPAAWAAATTDSQPQRIVEAEDRIPEMVE
jgi:hypothetical protein